MVNVGHVQFLGRSGLKIMTELQSNQSVTNQKWNDKFIHYTHHDNSCLSRVIERCNEYFSWDKKLGLIDKATLCYAYPKTIPYEWLETFRRGGKS